MLVFRGLPDRAEVSSVLTIGNFDGVHRGHQALLRLLVREARERAMPATVLTFEPHPREFFAPESAPPRLSRLREKLELMAEAGVDRVYVLRFNEELASLEAEEFVERILVPRARPNEYVRSYKISKRFDQDISAVCGGYRLVVEKGEVREAHIAYGGVAAIPKRAANCERALAGKPWNEETVRAATAALDRDYAPLTDMRASAAYRRVVTRNLLRRLFLETGGRSVATRVLEPVR